MIAERRAWDEFWKEQGRSGSACLERAPAPLRSAFGQHWRSFAATLAPGARILDLGCGGGAVGRSIATYRADLLLYGVDYAVVGGRRATEYKSIEASTAIEQLPFQDAQFDGATSQFGFEYSRLDESVAELGRVMAPGAPVSMIVHHAEGPIVADNRRSLLAYRRLLSRKMERLFIAGDQLRMERFATATASNVCDPTVELMRQLLRERVAKPRSIRMETWRAINEAMMPELALAAALDRIAVSRASIDGWLARFGDHFDEVRADAIEIGRMPFAWRIQARRKGSVGRYIRPGGNASGSGPLASRWVGGAQHSPTEPRHCS